MKCLCGYEGDDFTWLPLLEVCAPNYTATDEVTAYAQKKATGITAREYENQEIINYITEEMKDTMTGLPKSELKRSFACPRCGTVKMEISK